MELHENIKALRNARGWSQQRLAEMTNYSDRSSIAKIEAGKVDLPRSKIAEFAKIFNVTPAYLMGCEDPADSEAAAGDELTLTEKEKGVVKCYRKATDDDRTVVDAVLKKYQENPARAVRSAG